MKKWVFLLVIIASGIIQVNMPDYFKIFGVKPNLLLIAVVAAATHYRLRWVLFFSIISGIFMDAFSARYFALNTALFIFWGVAIYKLSRKIDIDNNFRRFVLIMVVVLLHNIISAVALLYLGNSIPLGIILRIIFFECLYTAFILPLLSILTRFIPSLSF